MATIEQDVDQLTEQRFRRMSYVGGGALPPVDMTGLPPGPRWPVLVQSAGLLRFRHWFHPYLHRRYGDVFTVRLVPGGRPLVFFTRPEHAKEIFAGDPEVFHAGKANAILGPIMGEHSLLLQDSGEHKRARKLLMPAFNGHALRGYESLVTDLARAEVGRWRPGSEIRALDRMNALTLEVILRVVFGVTDEARLAELRPRVNATVDISPAVLLGWGYPRLQRFGPWKRTVANQHELDRLIYAEIRERREAPDLEQRTDVLSRLILARDGEVGSDALDDTELRDQLVTLLLAGHETTATALAWSLFELGRHPDLLARSREAARTGDDAWLDAVLKESMRLHPVIPMVVRTLMEPATVGGWSLPAGTTVGPSIIISHGREDNHPDPEVFRPERFLGHNPPTNTWIPFGGGVRRCIGAGFSLMEGVAVLREVLTAYAVTAVGEDRPRVRNITSVPRRGARIRLSE
ncbi:cytochrome P450 [Nocardioides ungokensis]|uniref:cytochrome P450 n=1 Tax=Nocardioides ungokensis TaxID=1643322 RepID=UPI001C60833D|nr:cytochrome P450 [Nocardioides ungokensis]